MDLGGSRIPNLSSILFLFWHESEEPMISHGSGVLGAYAVIEVL